jgi:hypothetical protein
MVKRTKTRIAAGRNLLPKMIISGKNCPMVIEMLVSWQMHETSGVPKHDGYSHLGDAYSYFCLNHTNNKKRMGDGVRRKNYQLTSGGSIL